MKILLATDTWSPAVNGVVRSVQLLHRELQALGHDVRVLTLSGTCESTLEDSVYALGSVSAEQVYPGARVGVCPTSSLLRELERWKPDIVHTQSEFSVFLAARRIARHCGCPLLTRMFSPKLLQKYRHWTGEGSHFTQWFALAIFLPVAPDDFLCYLAGTTAMSWGIFTLIILACKPFAIALYSTGLNVAMHALLSC